MGARNLRYERKSGVGGIVWIRDRTADRSRPRLASVLALVLAPVLFLALAGAPSELRAAETLAKGAKVAGDADHTRFVADLSKRVGFRVFTLSDPYRVIVDMPDVKFQLPAGLGRGHSIR